MGGIAGWKSAMAGNVVEDADDGVGDCGSRGEGGKDYSSVDAQERGKRHGSVSPSPSPRSSASQVVMILVTERVPVFDVLADAVAVVAALFYHQ